MKKKIKDLTLSEMEMLCNKYQSRCVAGTSYCPLLFDHNCLLSLKRRKEEEVEVPNGKKDIETRRQVVNEIKEMEE